LLKRKTEVSGLKQPTTLFNFYVIVNNFILKYNNFILKYSIKFQAVM
jgi:hypothetical protein